MLGSLQSLIQAQWVSMWCRWRKVAMVLSIVSLLLISFGSFSASDAIAGIDDDRFDGNIFALYAGNGSLVPPRVSLEQSLQGERPTFLTFYVEDSSDCKTFTATVSQVQAYYGRALDIIPINVDSIAPQTTYSPTEPGAFYSGNVPQTLIFNADGQLVADLIGNVAYEEFDDRLRVVFDLLPRSESQELRRRSLNEVSVELAR